VRPYVLAIDPGTRTGAVVWHSTSRSVVAHLNAGTIAEALAFVREWAPRSHAVLVEQVRSQGQRRAPLKLNDILDAAATAGRLYQVADERCDRIEWVPRRSVLSWLGWRKGNRDAYVLGVMLHRVGPKGTKASPGPCYGIAYDGIQALGLAVAWSDRNATTQPARAAKRGPSLAG
jgi:hypothetical protein